MTSSTNIVFQGNIIEVGLLQSYLSDASIDSYIADEVMGTTLPWYVTPGGVGAVKLVVAKEDEEKVIELIKHFKGL